jgi:hypothetical protein
MDIDRITNMLGVLAAKPSRRAVGHAAVRIATGSMLAPLFGMTEGVAKKRRKKKRKSSPPPPTSPPPCTRGYLPECGGCCDSTKGEVCEDIPGQDGRCLTGGCPAVGVCTDSHLHYCTHFRSLTDLGCVCSTGIGLSETACIELNSPDCNRPCSSSVECGANGVCVTYSDAFCFCDDPKPTGVCATRCNA